MTRISNLLGVDFAALDTLCRVHRELSFTRAAEAIGVNQSAVSYTIDKLRQTFKDPLFVKQGGRQVATERCEVIVRGAQNLLEEYRSLVEPASFTPETAEAEFVIACNYYERLLIIPHVARQLGREAPNIRLSIINSSSDGNRLLLGSEADVVIGPNIPIISGFYAEDLFQEHYVCLMDRAHPSAAADLSLEQYLALRHILVTYGGNWRSSYIEALAADGHHLNVGIEIPSPAGIDDLISGSDYVATITQRMAERIGRFHAITPCPVPAPFSIALVWAAKTHASPLHRWIRSRIIDIARTIGSKPAGDRATGGLPTS